MKWFGKIDLFLEVTTAMQNMNKIDILISGILACLIILSGVMQMSLKGSPQIVMLIWSALTLLSLLISQGRVASFMFTILFGTLLAAAYFALGYTFAGWMSSLHINPEEIEHPSMPLGQVLLGFVGTLILTPLTIYHKHWHHRGIKITASALFFIITTVVFIVTEVRYW
jgi:glucan phosphoethanolaminetransferase (alkaline phosphatase superfamily)